MKHHKGWIVWEGKSLLDGESIVLLANRGAKQKNRKTGALIQTYILRSDIAPLEALHSGADVSICGDCPHRPIDGGSCYVRVEQAPTQIYKAYVRGSYPRLSLSDSAQQVAGQRVRLGTYGDPASVPLSVWESLLVSAESNTGYTHQWRHEASKGLEKYCMASCDNVAQATEAQARGWRSFAVLSKKAEAVPSHSFLCPASEEAGKKLTCEQCMACGGLSSPNKASVYIPVHGVAFKVARFEKLIQIGRI